MDSTEYHGPVELQRENRDTRGEKTPSPDATHMFS